MKPEDKSLKISSPVPDRKLHPISPILDEPAIVEALKQPINPHSTNEYLRTAATLAIMAGHDRQLMRSAVLQMMCRAVTMNEKLRMLEVVQRLLVDLTNGKQPLEKILIRMNEFAAQTLHDADELRQRLLGDMRKTMECAWENDPIN